jgi:hypothetical protein
MSSFHTVKRGQQLSGSHRTNGCLMLWCARTNGRAGVNVGCRGGDGTLTDAFGRDAPVPGLTARKQAAMLLQTILESSSPQI